MLTKLTGGFAKASGIPYQPKQILLSMKTKAADILRKFFHDLRFDKDHHLGIGDVRVTFGQQEDIVSKLEACDPIKTPCCGVALSGSALQPYPVYWNPHNGVVQCHCCGTIYDPRNSKPNHDDCCGQWPKHASNCNYATGN